MKLFQQSFKKWQIAIALPTALIATACGYSTEQFNLLNSSTYPHLFLWVLTILFCKTLVAAEVPHMLILSSRRLQPVDH